MNRSLIVLALSLIASSASAGSITIPGTSDLWLAGASAGTRASGFTPGSLGVDVAPFHSPVSVPLIPGQTYEFFATGLVSNGPTLPFFGPDGGPWLGSPTVSHFAGAENGIDDATIPLNALIGVWAGSSTPFLVGSHYVFSALGSTLYLGTMDGFEWNNNLGEFIVSWKEDRKQCDTEKPCPPEMPVPEPSTLVLVAVGLLLLKRK